MIVKIDVRLGLLTAPGRGAFAEGVMTGDTGSGTRAAPRPGLDGGIHRRPDPDDAPNVVIPVQHVPGRHPEAVRGRHAAPDGPQPGALVPVVVRSQRTATPTGIPV